MTSDPSKMLETLKARHSQLARKQIQAETHQDAAHQKLEELRREMKETYGVESVDELRELFEKSREEDIKNLEAFEKSLTECEEKLAQLEKGDQ